MLKIMLGLKTSPGARKEKPREMRLNEDVREATRAISPVSKRRSVVKRDDCTDALAQDASDSDVEIEKQMHRIKGRASEREESEGTVTAKTQRTHRPVGDSSLQSTQQYHGRRASTKAPEKTIENVESLRHLLQRAERKRHEAEECYEKLERRYEDDSISSRKAYEELQERFTGQGVRFRQIAEKRSSECDEMCRLAQRKTRDVENAKIKEIAHLRSEFGTFEQQTRKAAEEKDDEISKLRGQLLDIKQDISAMSRLPVQLADDSLREHIQALANDLQDWTVSHFRRAKIDFDIISPEMVAVVANAVGYGWTTASSENLQVCQAIVATMLMRILGSEFYFGIPQEDSLGSIANLVFSLQNHAAGYNEWRSHTARLLNELNPDDFLAYTPTMANELVETIESTLSKLLHVQADSRRRARLFRLVESAIKLSRVCSAQRARLLFTFPPPNDRGFVSFDPATMDDTSGQEDADLVGKNIKYALFPMVAKYGDEVGENAHIMNIISKAKVYCPIE